MIWFLLGLSYVSLSNHVRAADLSLLESASTCQMARAMVGLADAKIATADVARYGLQAVNICRMQLGEDHPDTLSSMNNLASSYSVLGQRDKALVLHERTLQLRRAKLGDDHPDTLISMNNLANTYRALGQHDKALDLNERTLQSRRTKLGEDHPNTLNSMGNLASTYGALGQHDKALDLNERTLQLRRAKLGQDHPDTLFSMGNLANTYGALGQNDKALMLNERTLQLMRSKLGEDHRDTLASMNNLASVYSVLGQRDKALVLHERTLQLRRAKLGDDHPDTLISMNNLANTYRALGQHDKALDLNERTLQSRRTKLGEDHPNTLNSMGNLASTYGALGQHDKALDLNERTLQLRRAKLGQDHPDTLFSMGNLANTYGALGQNDKALMQVANMVHGAEKLRALSGLGEEQRQSIFASYSDRYQLYAPWFVKANQVSVAFDLGDLSKARTLGEGVRAQAAMRSLPIAAQNQLLAAQAATQSASTRLERLAEQVKVEPSALLAAQKEVASENIKLLALQSTLKITNPKFAQLTDLMQAKTADAKRLLLPEQLFINYLIQTNGSAQVFTIDQTGNPQWQSLGSLANHKATVAAYRELTSPNTGASAQGQLAALKDGGYQWLQMNESIPTDAFAIAGTAGNPQAALKLLNIYWHDKLIKPIMQVASKYPRWIISPDKDLALLPFDALPDSVNLQGDINATLADMRQTTMVQSFSVYALLKQRELEYADLLRSKQLFAMGNAVYGDGWASGRGMVRASGTSSFEPKDRNASFVTTPIGIVDTATNTSSYKPAAEKHALSQIIWKNLPGTAREVNTIAQAFGAAADTAGKSISSSAAGVDTYIGLDASEAKLMALNSTGKLKDYRYLLFSAHGYLAQNSALSALVLSQQGNPEGVDGYVTAAEWPLYDIRSDLTVLSACDTGVGKTQAGEGVMGLPYALFIAGNKNTLLSLWPVDDDATAEFMRSFFTKLKAGTTQPEALSQTKREFMAHTRWSNPKYWAAFVLYGV